MMELTAHETVAMFEMAISVCVILPAVFYLVISWLYDRESKRNREKLELIRSAQERGEKWWKE